jgi:hypothetical protein
MISLSHFETLSNFPAKEWGCEPSIEWIELCEALQRYKWKLQPEAFPLARRWELVSALQKAIRRGEGETALQLIAKVSSLRDIDHAYFWKRLPIIACEDVGAGHEVLALFVIVCSQIFTPVHSRSVLFDVFGFLIDRLCRTSRRSRTACTVVSIEEMLTVHASKIILNLVDGEALREIKIHARKVDEAETPFRAWQKRNAWRTSGLLKFLDLALPLAHAPVAGEPPPCTQLHELPSYAYDMYTRSGREVLRRLTLGGRVSTEISDILNSRTISEPLVAAGEALFFAEGGYVNGEIECADLADLHHRVFAARFGLSVSEWRNLRLAMSRALRAGTIDTLRDRELGVRYAQASLFLA